jgi:hypothetical protein
LHERCEPSSVLRMMVTAAPAAIVTALRAGL